MRNNLLLTNLVIRSLIPSLADQPASCLHRHWDSTAQRFGAEFGESGAYRQLTIYVDEQMAAYKAIFYRKKYQAVTCSKR